MHVEATVSNAVDTGADTVVVGVFEGEGVAHDVGDGVLGGLVSSGEASLRLGRVAVAHWDGRRFLVVGLGPRSSFDGEGARRAAGAAHARARELSAQSLCWEVPHHVSDEVVAGLVEGTVLHGYRFDRYKRASASEDPPGVGRLIVSAHHDVSAIVNEAAVITAAQNRARDLGNTPANDLTPAALADYASAIPGVSVSVLDEDALRAAGMGSFAAVARGSHEGARLIRLEYDGAGGSGASVLGLVGKAITFDSGGLSLKTATSMVEMKFDMSGGGAVIEAVRALAELRAPVHVLGVVGSTENMPGGGAVKPSDIVTALDGTTIEINNTDAEGRLVLADCLVYARREGAERLVDIATLTGGIVTALGSAYAGLMSNDDTLAAAVVESGLRTGERVWRMPLDRAYADMVRGRYAQLTNSTEKRGVASSITAAEFLHHFAGDTPWAHLDIAGVSHDAPRDYLVGKGATGFGVRLLVDVARG